MGVKCHREKRGMTQKTNVRHFEKKRWEDDVREKKRYLSFALLKTDNNRVGGGIMSTVREGNARGEFLCSVGAP
jgi:hypothetical protein